MTLSDLKSLSKISNNKEHCTTSLRQLSCLFTILMASVAAAMRDTLHWLSFPHRVTYKLCLLTYKCLHGLAPDCRRSVSRSQLSPVDRISALLTVFSSWCPGRVQSRSDHVLLLVWPCVVEHSSCRHQRSWLDTLCLQAAAEDILVWHLILSWLVAVRAFVTI